MPPPRLTTGAQFLPSRFDELAVFRDRMASAVVRCTEIANNEKLMGYEDSWRTYADMASELSLLYSWLNMVLP